MRTVEIRGLVSLRKHSKRAAGLAATEAVVLPLLVLVEGITAAAIPAALVAGLTSAALFRGAFAAARTLTPLLAILNAILLAVAGLSARRGSDDGTYVAIVVWLAVFLYGSVLRRSRSLSENTCPTSPGLQLPGSPAPPLPSSFTFQAKSSSARG